MELIIGLDPDPRFIPDLFKTTKDTNIIDWGINILNTVADHVKGVKFQSAYFELFGLHGIQALSRVMDHARSLNLTIIMDAKRGDIGSTSQAYAMAYLSPKINGRPNEFIADFLTVNPLMGEDCLDPFVDVAHANQRGIFILLETSNPGASMILKQSTPHGTTMAEKIGQYIQKKHEDLNIPTNEWGPIGVVIGATNDHVSHWRTKLPNSIFLMPGIGAQGGHVDALKSCLNDDEEGVWVPVSRGITTLSKTPTSIPDFNAGIRHNLESILTILNS